MLFLNCIPAAEIFDRCQLHLQVKSICMLFQDRLINRPIVILRDQLLRFIGIQIFQISFCGICVIVFFYIFIYNSNGRLCQDTDARCYDLVIIRIVPYRKKRFIFPGDQHITLSVFHEGSCGTSGSGIQNQDIFVKLLDKSFHLCLISVVFLFGISPGCHVIPAGTSGSFRVWCNHSHTILRQIIPVVDVLRISLPYQKYNGGSIRSTVIRIFINPAIVDQSGILDCINVVFQGKCCHICRKSVGNLQRLFSRTAMRLDHIHTLAGFPFPVICKDLVVFLIKFSGWIIGHIDDLYLIFILCIVS